METVQNSFNITVQGAYKRLVYACRESYRLREKVEMFGFEIPYEMISNPISPETQKRLDEASSFTDEFAARVIGAMIVSEYSALIGENTEEVCRNEDGSTRL